MKENNDAIKRSNEMKSMLNDRLKEDKATFLTLKESMDRLINKYVFKIIISTFAKQLTEYRLRKIERSIKTD